MASRKGSNPRGKRPRIIVPRNVPGMAPDKAPPLPADRVAFRAWRSRLELRAGAFLLSGYLSYIEDGGFDFPMRYFEAQPGETPAEAEQRRDISRRLKELQTKFGTWREQCDEDIAQTRPSEADTLAVMIIDYGIGWAARAPHTTPTDGMLAAATSLLDVMCPPEHHTSARTVAERIVADFPRARGIVETAARQSPIAAIHAAAAIASHLFVACVEDPNTEKLTISDRLIALNN